MDNNKLTEHELTKRLDNEFSDVDFTYHESPTKGVLATITFYEDKLEDEAKRLDAEYYQNNKK